MGKPVQGDPGIDKEVQEVLQKLKATFCPGGNLSEKRFVNLDLKTLRDLQDVTGMISVKAAKYASVRYEQALGGHKANQPES